MKLIHGSYNIKFRKGICNLNKNNMINDDDGQIHKQAFTWSESSFDYICLGNDYYTYTL